mgnify:CR=1 FL=1
MHLSTSEGETELIVDEEDGSVASDEESLVGVQAIPVNGFRTKQSIVVVAPMPGVRPEDVEVATVGSRLYLRAELRSKPDKDYLVHEWRYGRYGRTVVWPHRFQGEIPAWLGNGQLAVSVAAVDDPPRSGDGARPRLVRPHDAGSGA